MTKTLPYIVFIVHIIKQNFFHFLFQIVIPLRCQLISINNHMRTNFNTITMVTMTAHPVIAAKEIAESKDYC